MALVALNNNDTVTDKIDKLKEQIKDKKRRVKMKRAKEANHYLRRFDYNRYNQTIQNELEEIRENFKKF